MHTFGSDTQSSVPITTVITPEIKSRFEKDQTTRYNVAVLSSIIRHIVCPRCNKSIHVIKVKSKFRCTDCRITFEIMVTANITKDDSIAIKAKASTLKMTGPKSEEEEIAEIIQLVSDIRKQMRSLRDKRRYAERDIPVPESLLPIIEKIEDGSITDEDISGLTTYEKSDLSRLVKNRSGVKTSNGRKWPRPPAVRGGIPWGEISAEKAELIKTNYGKNSWRAMVLQEITRLMDEQMKNDFSIVKDRTQDEIFAEAQARIKEGYKKLE